MPHNRFYVQRATALQMAQHAEESSWTAYLEGDLREAAHLQEDAGNYLAHAEEARKRSIAAEATHYSRH